MSAKPVIVLKRFLIYSLLTVVLLISASAVAVFFLQDKIIAAFIGRANAYLATPVRTGQVEISLLRHFPLLSLTFHDVRVEDSHSDQFALFTARRVDLSFSASDAWNGKYEILGLEVTDSKTHIRYNDRNESNFSILRDTTKESESLRFDIRNITLNRTLVTYADVLTGDEHQFKGERIRADLAYADGVYAIRTTGDILIDQLRLGKKKYLTGKKFDASAVLTADPEASSLEIDHADLRYGDAAFSLNGFYDFGNEPRMDLRLEGLQTTLQTIQTFLPEDLAERLSPYESTGQLRFSVRLSGATMTSEQMVLVAEFGCRDATFRHPSSGFLMEQARLSGKFTLLGMRREKGTELQLDSLSGKLNGKPFQGRILWQDQADPYVDLSCKGDIEAADLVPFLPDQTLRDLSGTIRADVEMRGKLYDLKSRETAGRFIAAGSFRLKDFSAEAPALKTRLEGWNGTFTIEGNEVSLDKLGGRIGRSDLLLSGRVKNLIGYLFLNEQHVGADLTLKSRRLDVDELMAIGPAASGGSVNEKKFSINPRLHLRLKSEVGHLTYDRLHAGRLSGDITIDQEEVRLKDLEFHAWGGDVALDGTLNAATPGKVRITSAIKLDRTGLDSLFYVFHDFGQSFISQKHVRGSVDATVKLDFMLDAQLNILPEHFTANLAFDIQKGQLNDFEPLYRLNKYLDDGGLRRLRFADLRNEIHIQDQTVFIPDMEIRSNLTTIQLAGKHTFDQHIDYRIVVPLSSRRGIDEEEAGAALERDDGGKSKLYLKITGTTDQYDVAYDGSAVRKKITGEIRNEAKSLKESFRKKETPDPKKKPRLSEEAFDWDN